jgi:hypothetical protein
VLCIRRKRRPQAILPSPSRQIRFLSYTRAVQIALVLEDTEPACLHFAAVIFLRRSRFNLSAITSEFRHRAMLQVRIPAL